jgi:hypothetical protein
MNSIPSRKSLPTLIAAIITVAVLSVGATKIVNFDIWWHLKTGEIIWNSANLLSSDIFSYTIAGTPWLNHEWLFELFAWLAYSAWGITALIVFKTAMTAGVALISYRSIKLLAGSQSWAMWGTLLLLWSIAGRLMARPFMLTLLLVALFCYLLHLFASGKRRALWATIPLTIIWVNWHGGGILAPALILAYALGESIQAKLKGPSAIPAGNRRLLWLIGGLVLAASALNPMGIDTFVFPFQHTDMNAIMAYTQEWLPVMDPRLSNLISVVIIKIAIPATMISYILNRRSARMSHIMLTILTSFILLKGKRFAPHFMIVNIPILILNLTIWFKRFPRPAMKKDFFRWLSIIIAAGVVVYGITFGVPLTTDGAAIKHGGIGVVSQFAPEGMVNFLEENSIHGNVFNDMAFGGYLILRRWPNDKVFIDGRTPLYGDDFYRQYVEAFRSEDAFKKLDTKYHFDYLVFKSRDAWNLRGFHKYLWNNPKWSLVYMRGDGIVYLRNNRDNVKLIKRLALKKNELVEKMDEVEKSSTGK